MNTCIVSYSIGPVPDTGIDECYDNADVIPCPSPGQPFYGQDAQYVTNPMSYTVSPDGLSVTDNVTGLMWQRMDDDTGRNWADALAYCEGLSFGGHTDWRLPNEYELQSIALYGNANLAIDPKIFLGAKMNWYWSSSTNAAQTNLAWWVTYGDGSVHQYSKANMYYVRCVRGESVARSFTGNLDGTVTDNATCLMWQREDDNQARNWESALAYCEDLNLGGHSDWRLPDVKEIRSIVDNMRYDPAIDPTAFPGTKIAGYWSSSTNASVNAFAWVVHFEDGGVYSAGLKTSIYYVRCVR